MLQTVVTCEFNVHGCIQFTFQESDNGSRIYITTRLNRFATQKHKFLHDLQIREFLNHGNHQQITKDACALET